eukprot:6712982-Prymnesium_polylepis.1
MSHAHALEHAVHDLTVEHVRFRCMQYWREKLLYTPSTTTLHQPHPVTRGLQSSTALQSSTVFSFQHSSTVLYSIQLSALYSKQPLRGTDFLVNGQCARSSP